jgi:hypothetical protein
MNAASTWISRNVGRLRSADGKAAAAKEEGAAAPKAAAPERSTHERLQATLRKSGEALSPRALRRVLADLQEVVAPRVSEIEGGRRAQLVAAWYAEAAPEERRDMWLLMCEQFAPDATRFKSAQQRYEAAAGTADAPQAEAHLRRALVSPRTRLLQRFAVFPEGMRFLVDLRAEMLPQLKGDKRLLPLEAELEQLFATWFDVAFLELKRLSWDSPASLIEKLIKYEAVHDIRSWADLKNRLDSDRRCYGFFHPRLPGEPLIFVEVALVNEISESITPLLDESAAPEDIKRATTAIFYSISNTQTGLRRELRRLAHQARGGDAHRRVPAPAHLRHAVAHSGLPLLAVQERRRADGAAGRQEARRTGPSRRLRAAAAHPRAGRGGQRAGAAPEVARAPAAAAMRRALPGPRAERRQARGPRGALPPGQRRPRGTPELGGRPLGQGPQAIVRPHGQLRV